MFILIHCSFYFNQPVFTYFFIFINLYKVGVLYSFSLLFVKILVFLAYFILNKQF